MRKDIHEGGHRGGNVPRQVKTFLQDKSLGNESCNAPRNASLAAITLSLSLATIADPPDVADIHKLSRTRAPNGANRPRAGNHLDSQE